MHYSNVSEISNVLSICARNLSKLFVLKFLRLLFNSLLTVFCVQVGFFQCVHILRHTASYTDSVEERQLLLAVAVIS